MGLAHLLRAVLAGLIPAMTLGETTKMAHAVAVSPTHNPSKDARLLTGFEPREGLKARAALRDARL
jgi:hypothetical protein